MVPAGTHVLILMQVQYTEHSKVTLGPFIQNSFLKRKRLGGAFRTSLLVFWPASYCSPRVVFRYALYSITDKVLSSLYQRLTTSTPDHFLQSSSFFGPLIVGLIADATGNIRYGFFFIVIMILTPVPVLLWKVSIPEGRRDAQQYIGNN